MKTALRCFLPFFVAATAAGCVHDHSANSPDDASQATPELSVAAPTESQPDTAAALTDEQILQVTHTANLGEIEQGALAQGKAKDARVKQLAAMMVNDHTAADQKGMDIAKRAKLNLARSAASTSLEEDARTATTSLKSLTGDEFDKAYVDTQVKEHRAVLDTIDHKLVPAAKNAEVKAYLAEVRPTIASHLQHAQDLQKTLAEEEHRSMQR